uniref:Uncharacterized protein n=1 Tax=Leersia perrieri TaxID=77586 RepID=A0A0D9VM39_9ORYZ
MALDVDVLLGENPLDDFVVCDVALDTLDTDPLGEIPGDDTAEERALLSFSVRSIRFDRALVPPVAAVLIGETPRDGIVTAAGLASLPTLMFFDTSAVPLEAVVGVLGEPTRDETDEDTNRSILSARSILLVNAFAADDSDVLFGETPRDGIDDRAGLPILSVRSTLLDIELTDTLPPIIAGHLWWSITLACGFGFGFSGCSVALLPLIGLLFLSPAIPASLVLEEDKLRIDGHSPSGGGVRPPPPVSLLGALCDSAMASRTGVDELEEDDDGLDGADDGEVGAEILDGVFALDPPPAPAPEDDSLDGVAGRRSVDCDLLAAATSVAAADDDARPAFGDGCLLTGVVCIAGDGDGDAFRLKTASS